MNIRDRVHFAPQDSLCLNYNELKSIGTYYRPTTNNGVGHRFVLGCQQSDCSKGWRHAGHSDDSNGFGKCVVGGVHFHQLLTDEVPLPAEDNSPQKLRSTLKSKRSDSVSDQTFVDWH